MYNVANSWVNNAWSATQAQRAWNRSVEASKNAHQWEVEDLRKAGLNPILSATGGNGAHVPSPIQAQVNVGKTSSPTDIASVVNSSRQLDLMEQRQDKELELLEKKTNEEVELLKHQQSKTISDAALADATTAKVQAEEQWQQDENIRLAEKFGFEKHKLQLANELSLLDKQLKAHDIAFRDRQGFKWRLLSELKGMKPSEALLYLGADLLGEHAIGFFNGQVGEKSYVTELINDARSRSFDWRDRFMKDFDISRAEEYHKQRRHGGQHFWKRDFYDNKQNKHDGEYGTDKEFRDMLRSLIKPRGHYYTGASGSW